MAIALTEDNISMFSNRPGRSVELEDSLVPGFGVRITGDGARLFFVRYAAEDGTERCTFFRTERITVERARRLAQRIIDLARRGEDPKGAARKRLETVRVGNSDFAVSGLFPDLATTWLRTALGPKQGWVQAGERAALMREYVMPLWRAQPVRDIDPLIVRRAVDQIADQHGRRTAEDVVRILDEFFEWAISVGHVRGDAVMHLDTLLEDIGQSTELGPEDLRRLWRAACANPEDVGGRLFRLAMATAGLRLEDLAGMRWDHIDFDVGGACWRRRPLGHSAPVRRIPLSSLANSLLSECDDHGDSVYVFAEEGGAREAALEAWEAFCSRVTGHVWSSLALREALQRTLAVHCELRDRALARCIDGSVGPDVRNTVEAVGRFLALFDVDNVRMLGPRR